MNGGEPLLALDAIAKRYGDVDALAGGSLVVRPGTVHALLGENGAGKTTLMRVAFGLVKPDSGIIRWHGTEVNPGSPRDALAAGIGMVQQHFSLVPSLSVAENVALGGHGLYDVGDARRRVRELGETAGLSIDPDAIAGTLGMGAQQRVEIIKAMARGVKLLILDEPTATLAPADAAALLSWARRFARDDRAVVLITHKLRDALGIADEVTVLRSGRVVLAAAADSVTEGALARAMLGGEMPGLGVDPSRWSADATPLGSGGVVSSSRAVVELHDVGLSAGRGTPGLSNVSFAARRGEIVGVAAVEGNGERELLRVLAGRARVERGVARLPARIGYIPQDRHADAIADSMTLTENVALAGAGTRRGWIDWTAMRSRTERVMARFDVRASGAGAPAATLSGGNQQRLVLARELDGDPELVVADQPTRGLDLRATAEVLERLRRARVAGAAVVVYSADLDEIVELADRVVVVVGGTVREVSGGRDAIGRAMLGLGTGE